MAWQIDAYEPLYELKPFGPDIWLADGPLIDFKAGIVTVPYPTRMTIVRLKDGRLWLHSPVPLTDKLKAQVDALGEVAYLVAPNKIHYWWIGEWMVAYPDAQSFAAPRVEERSWPEKGVRFDHELTNGADTPWAGEIAFCVVEGHVLSEAVFFHAASRTLIVTDLIENFEPEKVHGFWTHLLLRLTGIMAPNGAAPRDLRATFFGRKAHLRAKVQKMLSWEPEKIILAHGACIESGALSFLRRSFRWAGIKPA